jgi:protein-S-isoprenylcysteine O-methyltransferase
LHPLPFSGGPRYAVLFRGTYLLWVALETISSRTKRSGDRSRVSDRGSFSLILILLWVALGADFALSFLLPQANILWNRTAIFYLGISLMLAGMAFRFYAMSVLGRFFTYDVAVHVGQTVVEAGPYRYIRHPSYTRGLITLAGLGLALGNWAGLLA